MNKIYKPPRGYSAARYGDRKETIVMKKTTCVIFAIFVSFLCCFMCVGYAQLSTDLTISGAADVEAQKNVFITDAVKTEGSAEINGYYGTVLTSSVSVENSDTVIRITVYNNSNYTYVFNGVLFDEAAYSNLDIKFELSGIIKGDEIEGGKYKTFDVIFSPAKASLSSTDLSSVLNFQFVPHEDYIPEIAVSGALDQFEKILNTKIDYDELIEYMNDTANTGRPNSSYIGNVVGANSKDSSALNEMFTHEGENMLVLDINGEKTNVTAMIKRENVDGNASTGASGDEMTIYMTAADLTKISAWGNRSVTVYAAVFTKYSEDGDWEPVGQMYEGKANANNYEGSWFGAINSFNTDTWKSSLEYYGVSSGATIEALTQAAKAAE